MDTVKIKEINPRYMTKKNLNKVEEDIAKIVRSEFKALRRDIKIIVADTKGNSSDFKAIRDKLDEFIDIMKHFARQQKILIRKMQEIEDYFDPKIKN
jgi:hypothetical protein